VAHAVIHDDPVPPTETVRPRAVARDRARIRLGGRALDPESGDLEEVEALIRAL
jgi:hypothetical protein